MVAVRLCCPLEPFSSATIPHGSPIATARGNMAQLAMGLLGAKSRGWLRTAAACVLFALVGARQAVASPPAIAYLNVSDGTTAIFGAAADDATQNLSAIATVAPFPAFMWPQRQGNPPVSPAQAQAYLMFELHKAFLPYNLIWTDTRPLEGAYTMVLVGGTPELLGFDPRVAGVAVMDCNDAQPSSVVFAFPNALPGNLHGLFVTAAQETAHAFGLEHTDDPEDIMNGLLMPSQWTFSNQTNLITRPRVCGPLAQNSHQKLLSVLGAWPAGIPKPLGNGTIPDTTPPSIVIISPVAGQVAAPSVQVAATVSDESNLAEVVVQTSVGTRKAAMQGRQVTITEQFQLPEGDAKAVVWARDANGNQGFVEVNFRVAASAVPDGGCRYYPSRHRATSGVLALFVLILALGTCRKARR